MKAFAVPMRNSTFGVLVLMTSALGFSALQPIRTRWVHLESTPEKAEDLSHEFPGLVELAKTVELLNRPLDRGGCPWTNEQTVRSLVKHLQGELEEVKEALDALDNTLYLDVNNTGNFSNYEAKSNLLAEECGDVLFNALMLCAALPTRNPASYLKSDMDDAALHAAAKIRRRTPYMDAWGAVGDNRSDEAVSMEEAQSAWQAAKRTEGV